ncbi:hypothetical protein [Streptomyces violascens]|uniref:hypothetical protein n=1 Tax=Streptomyces violascens TaxID=67381 RepID=UPI00167BED03|nr:hypothetical protein [Streptomyces violascens]
MKGAAAAVRSYLASGDEVLLVGEPVSPADACVTPTVGQDGGVRTVRSPQDAACLRVRDQNRLAFVVAPGSATDQIAGILGVLRTRFPRLRGQHPDGWCYTMTDLLATSRSVLAESDTVLLAGDAETPHTAAVRASGCGTPAHRIRGLNDLFVHHIDAPTIALTGSHTAVGELVLRVLSGLGPLSTVERTTRTRVGGECVASAVATGNNGAVGRSAD